MLRRPSDKFLRILSSTYPIEPGNFPGLVALGDKLHPLSEDHLLGFRNFSMSFRYFPTLFRLLSDNSTAKNKHSDDCPLMLLHPSVDISGICWWRFDGNRWHSPSDDDPATSRHFSVEFCWRYPTLWWSSDSAPASLRRLSVDICRIWWWRFERTVNIYLPMITRDFPAKFCWHLRNAI